MSFISCVPRWLAVIGIQAQLLFKKSCLWEKNKLQAASEVSCEPIVIPWTICFTVRVTESGPKSGKNSIVLLETEKVILLDCRLKVYKMRQKMICRVNVAAIRKSTQLCRKCTVFLPFWAPADVGLIVISGFFSPKKQMNIFRLDMLDNTNLQKHVDLSFSSVHKCKSLGQTLTKRFYLFFTGNIADSAGGLELRTSIITSFKWLRIFLWKKIYLNTLYSDNTRSQNFW